jgi:cytochrome c556
MTPLTTVRCADVRNRLVPLAMTLALAPAGVSCSPPRSTTAAPQLWGTMTPVVSVKELMRDMIDPIADNIFDAVGITTDDKGTHERVPTSEADWEKIRIGAVTMAEGAYLLKIPRPWTPPGDNNDSEGPDAPELSPAEIEAKVKADPVEWNARIEALRNVGLEVLDIVRRKDVAELWDASENLDTACEACHRSYWYPKEDAQFYEKLDRRLRELPQTTPR